MSDTFNLYSFSVLLFCIVYSCVILFILILYKKRDKVARPFLFSLFLHFFLDIIGIILLYLYNSTTHFSSFTSFSDEEMLRLQIYGSTAIMLFMVSPLYLIFNIEKFVFTNNPRIKEGHIITKIQIICIIIMILTVNVIPGIAFLCYAIVTFIQMGLFLWGFLYLSMKSTDRYRRNALLVFGGYLWQFISNLTYFTITQIYEYSNPLFLTMIGITVISRLIGLTIMAYGLIKLYAF